MSASKIAMVLLALVAVFHLVRVFYGWDFIIGTWAAPMWVSYIGILVPGGLSYMLFKEG